MAGLEPRKSIYDASVLKKARQMGSQPYVTLDYNKNYRVFWDEAKTIDFTKWSYPILENKEKDMSIAQDLRNLDLSEDDRLIQKYYLRDSEGDLTSTGVAFLNEILFEQHKDVIVEKLKRLEEAKKESK